MCATARLSGWRPESEKARTRYSSFISTWVRCDMEIRTKSAEQVAAAVHDLKTNAVFADLPEADLTWLAERMEEILGNVGDVYGRLGDPLEYLIVMLEGEMQIERPEDQGTPFYIASAGQVTGRLPFSRSTNYKGTAR